MIAAADFSKSSSHTRQRVPGAGILEWGSNTTNVPLILQPNTDFCSVKQLLSRKIGGVNLGSPQQSHGAARAQGFFHLCARHPGFDRRTAQGTQQHQTQLSIQVLLVHRHYLEVANGTHALR